jgi:hypothetical protein
MSLQELVDFKDEAIGGSNVDTYTQNVNHARWLAAREYTATELLEHQEAMHQQHPSEFEEQAPTYQDLFERRRSNE